MPVTAERMPPAAFAGFASCPCGESASRARRRHRLGDRPGSGLLRQAQDSASTAFTGPRHRRQRRIARLVLNCLSHRKQPHAPLAIEPALRMLAPLRRAGTVARSLRASNQVGATPLHHALFGLRRIAAPVAPARLGSGWTSMVRSAVTGGGGVHLRPNGNIAKWGLARRARGEPAHNPAGRQAWS